MVSVKTSLLLNIYIFENWDFIENILTLMIVYYYWIRIFFIYNIIMK